MRITKRDIKLVSVLLVLLAICLTVVFYFKLSIEMEITIIGIAIVCGWIVAFRSGQAINLTRSVVYSVGTNISNVWYAFINFGIIRIFRKICYNLKQTFNSDITMMKEDYNAYVSKHARKNEDDEYS